VDRLPKRNKELLEVVLQYGEKLLDDDDVEIEEVENMQRQS